MSDRSDTVPELPHGPGRLTYRVVHLLGILPDMVIINPHIRTLLTPILEEVNHSLHTYILDHSSPSKYPELILESLLAQLSSEAEIAEFCTTERSRPDRRRALVRGAGAALLALVVMDRESLAEARSHHLDGDRVSVSENPNCDL